MDLKEVKYEGMNQIILAYERHQSRVTVNTVMKFLVPLKAGNLLTSLTTISFSRRISVWSYLNILHSFFIYYGKLWLSAIPYPLITCESFDQYSRKLVLTPCCWSRLHPPILSILCISSTQNHSLSSNCCKSYHIL